MADIAAGGRLPAPAARKSKRRRGAGIYGAIITAAILFASSIAVGLGVTMIVLTDVVLTHLH